MTYSRPISRFPDAPVFDIRTLPMAQMRRKVARRSSSIKAALAKMTTPRLILLSGSVFFAFALALFILSFPAKLLVAKNDAPQSLTAVTTSAQTTNEMNIAQNGLTLLRGAKVTAINGTTLSVSAAWGTTEFEWTVVTHPSSYGKHNFGTRFLNSAGTPVSIQDIHVGDTVTVSGTIDSSVKNPTLQGDSVRIVK